MVSRGNYQKVCCQPFPTGFQQQEYGSDHNTNPAVSSIKFFSRLLDQCDLGGRNTCYS
jgi:hypothetical protein